MTGIVTKQITAAWDTLRSLIPLAPIRNERQYDQAVKKLNELLDIIGDDETHPLYDLLDTLGILIQNYEETNYPAPPVTGVEVLRFLMEERHLALSDFPEVGDEQAVSEVLAGKRELKPENIRALSKRFGVSPATFI